MSDQFLDLVASGGIARSENRLISFFQRTKALLDEAGQCTYVFSCVGDIHKIDILHERLSKAGETVFILKERAAELVCSNRDLEIANFHSNMNEVSTHLTSLRVYFENMAHYLTENTLNMAAHQCEREYRGMRRQPKFKFPKGKYSFFVSCTFLGSK